MENEPTFFAASACKYRLEGQNLWLWVPLCSLCKMEEKLSTAAHRAVTVLPSGATTGTSYTSTLCSSSIVHQWISESIRAATEWRDDKWLNTFLNGKVLFSFYRWEAEAKGTWVILAQVTVPEVTSNFLNAIPKAQEGPLGSFTFLTPTKNFSITMQSRVDTLIHPYHHLQPASLQGIFCFCPPSLAAKELSTSVLVPYRATARSCSNAERRLWPRQLLFSSILQQTSWS